MHRIASKLLFVCVSVLMLLGSDGSVWRTADVRIQAADLRGDLSFLASDALQGRYAPSPGLDIAAEWIASQFRAAGLEPGGNPDYFQTVDMADRRLPVVSGMTLQQGPRVWRVRSSHIDVLDANYAANIDRAPVILLPARDPDLLGGADLAGKAVMVQERVSEKVPRDKRPAIEAKRRAFYKAVANAGAVIEIIAGSKKGEQSYPTLVSAEDALQHQPPQVVVAADELPEWLLHSAGAENAATVSLQIGAPESRQAVLKNVIGVLRGSDPKLKDTFVLLTAHYDHIGTSETAKDLAEARTQDPNDLIYNGANDDGSGTVSVIEIARAFARAHLHPKRSIVFMTFFGEERGDVGSEYYAAHPVFPIAKTVADINLEQVGRTDSTVGRQFRTASLTGFDYSSVTRYFVQAGRATGIKVYMDKEASDSNFDRSDNEELALRGVPAHTLFVAYDFPDYHGLGDEWQKIDYENMAQVDRMVALGLWNLANSVTAPKWNAQNQRTAVFRDAQKRNAGQ